MLEVKEGVGEEIREVDPFLWTSDKTASEQVSAVSTQVSAGWDDNGDVFFDFDNKLLESITAERRSSEYCLVQNNPNGPQVCLSVILVRQKYLWSHVKR